MKKLFTLSILASALFVSACHHHRDVRPGVNGVHKVKVQSGDQRLSSRDAIDQANYFCEQRQQYAAIINENTQYVGTMNEATYNALRTASTAATVAGAGTGAYAFASGKSSKSKTTKAAALATAGGALGKAVVTDGYMTEMTFKCQ